LSAYETALRLCRNFIPNVAGSLENRPGTLFVGMSKSQTERSRLLPFIFNESAAYTIELGHLYARFYKNTDVRLENPPGTPVEIVTPWTEDELFDLQWSHDADTLVVTHKNHQPRLIQRVSDVSWTITTLGFTYGPYLSRNEVEANVYARETGSDFFAKLTIAGGAGATEFRSAPVTRTVTANGPVFEIGRDEDRLIVIGDGNLPASDESYAVGRITTVVSTTEASVQFFDGRVDVAGPDSTVNWWMQAYYESTLKKRWPVCCTFAQQRLWLGGGETGTDLLHASRLGSITDFDSWSYADVDPPSGGAGAGNNTDQHLVIDSSGILVELSYPEVSEVRWLRGSKKKLAAGSSRVVFIVAPPENDGFSPLVALDASPSAVPGADSLPAIAINERIHFISSSRRQLQRIAFSLEADAYVPADLTQLNADILAPGVRDLAAVLQPEPVVWAATDDGRLVGGTIDEASHVIAWHEHMLGGLGVEQEWGEVESVAAIPSPDGSYEQLWMLVRRTVLGVEARYVERMDARFPKEAVATEQRYVDARGLAYSGAPTTVYTVGTHLMGETVDILADGGADAPQAVNGAGQVTLASAASDIVAGLPFESTLRSLPLLQASRFGLTMGETYRFSRLVLRLIHSLGGSAGAGHADDVQVYPLPIRQTRDALGAPPPLFTGILVVPTSGPATEDPQVEVRHSGPTHFELAALGALYDVSDAE
jgi:hypothetical protein